MRRHAFATKRIFALLAVLMTAGRSLRAAGYIQDVNARWEFFDQSFSPNPLVDFTGVSSAPADDHLNLFGWWYRIAGDTSETFFPQPNLEAYTGNHVTMGWSNVNSRGFNAQVEYTVTDSPTPPGGKLVAEMRIRNDTGATLTIDIFNMTDINLIPLPSDDAASLLTPNNHIQTTDGASNLGEYKALSAASYLVLPFGAGDVGAQLNDSNADSFPNFGLPLPASNHTMGFQFETAVMAPSEVRYFTIMLSINENLPIGSPSPTPSPSATASPTPTPTASRTATPTPSRTPTPTASMTPTPSVSRTATPTASRTATPTPSRTPTATASRTPTPSASATPSTSASPTPSVSPTPSPTSIETTTPSPTDTPAGTETPSPTVTGTPVDTPTPSPTVTATATATPAVSSSPTASPTPNAARDWAIYE